MLRDYDDDTEYTGVWDKRTKKTMIGAFIFCRWTAAGVGIWPD